MSLARKLEWRARILKYANSGDAPLGDKNNVVGYGVVIFSRDKKTKSPATDQTNKRRFCDSRPTNDSLDDEQKQKLLDIAKTAVENRALSGKTPNFNVDDERLNRNQGAFVTLRKNGKLRGCVGWIFSPGKPLWQVVRDAALAAAFGDDRFEPVRAEELNDLNYEISVLSTPRTVVDWRDIELGKHGVIIKKQGRIGVFLPQVARETGWTKEEFLSRLCFQKMGLPPDCYKDKDAEIQVFTAQAFESHDA